MSEEKKYNSHPTFYIVTTITLMVLLVLVIWSHIKTDRTLSTLRVNYDEMSHKMYHYSSKGADTLIDKEQKIGLMEKTLMINYDLSWWEAHYYSIIMNDFSRKYGIPWEIYAAVIRIESNFDPTLRSNKAAKGLTQVLEKTGKEVSDQLGIKYVEQKTLWNDILNIVIGFTYLSEHIEESGMAKGVKIYNGGPGFQKGHKGIRLYRTTVNWEYERLVCIHQGIKNGADSLLQLNGPVSVKE